MAPPPDLPVATATVCLTCGDKGETKRLIYCRNCRDSAVHHYCMQNFSPDDDNINWWCWDCEPKDVNAEPSRKSERISSKRQKFRGTTKHLKERLNQMKRQLEISNDVTETGGLTTNGHLSIWDLETKLVNDRHRGQGSLEKELIPEITSYPEEHNESTKIDDPTFATKCSLPHQQVNQKNSFDETQKIQEFGQEMILLLKDGASTQDEGKTVDQLLPLEGNDHYTISDRLYELPSLEPDDCLSAEPVSAPIWRGWLNIKEQSETCVQILAHLSSKACLKVSDAANGMPPMLDVQLLDRHAIWPKSFRITPPTTASIALYFFPASERDERVYDSLLDAVIEKELALKVMINDIELLIFSSCELPLQNWRYNSKYYLWGVFRKNHRVNSSSKDIVLSQYADDPYQPSQSPLSIKSSQASNIYHLSKNNTPDSLACPSFALQAGQDSGTR